MQTFSLFPFPVQHNFKNIGSVFRVHSAVRTVFILVSPQHLQKKHTPYHWLAKSDDSDSDFAYCDLLVEAGLHCPMSMAIRRSNHITNVVLLERHNQLLFLVRSLLHNSQRLDDRIRTASASGFSAGGSLGALVLFLQKCGVYDVEPDHVIDALHLSAVPPHYFGVYCQVHQISEGVSAKSIFLTGLSSGVI